VDVREGTPVDVISQSVAEAGSSLIAMSAHGHGGISRLMLGSVAASVLRATSAPVLLWKAPEERPPEPR
jgi:nucleotide-binding universal stress UspA family protein